ncbi:MAG: flavin-containing monooxygenase, partial [Anaeromyxobacteraceae bacterium]
VEAPVREAFAVVLGTGFSGLAAAAALDRAGVRDVVLLERSSALGGTWRDNQYPGCACDVPSYLYSFSFAPGHDWTRKFAPAAEIRAYLERCADALDVRRRILFGREAVLARWDEARARWRVRTRGGEEFLSRVLVAATGALSNPAYPALRGVERFRGPRFHSARWDHAADLAGKRVAVVGTGASAIQLVPHVQRVASRLYLLQRTPPWILPRRDRAYHGWERALLRRVPPLRWLYRQSIYWQLEGRGLAFVSHPRLMRVVAAVARWHLARSVRDPALRAALTPAYTPGCKRILLSDDYYPAVAQPNVEVVTEAIDEVREGGIALAGGRVLDVDAIVYGTGFDVHAYLGGLAVVGHGGLRLADAWQDGAEAYLGTMVTGFPNLFVMTGPNTGLGHNSMVVMIEGQARWMSRAVRLLRERGLASLEPRPDAQGAYNAWLRGRTAGTVWLSGCRSWYLDPGGRNTVLWPGFASGFRARTARLREGDLALRPARSGVEGWKASGGAIRRPTPDRPSR